MRGKKMLRPLAVFLVFMLACTMLSRASSTLTTAVVQTVSPGKMVIVHKVTAAGKIQENRELAVSAQAGQKIAQISVREGEQVDPGDVLLQMDMDMLEEQISARRQELEKIRLEAAGSEAAREIQEQKRDRAVRRAQEDCAQAAAKGDQAVARAAQEWDRAVAELNGYRQTAEILDGQEIVLEEAVGAAQEAYEDALSAREESIRGADRALEDALVEEAPDPAIQLKEVEAKGVRAQLRKLKRIQKTGGKICAPVKGTVTRIQVSVGELTAETPLLFLADLGAGCRFTAQVEKSQEEYVTKGAPVSLTDGQKKQTVKDLKIDSVKPNAEDPALLDVCVYLTADVLEIGDSAEMTVEQKSGTYNTCIPIQALHQANGTYFVYVIQEEETIMGGQLTARRVDVTVQEQNETYAALDDGCLSGSQRVIRDASKTIDEGSPVRLDGS